MLFRVRDEVEIQHPLLRAQCERELGFGFSMAVEILAPHADSYIYLFTCIYFASSVMLKSRMAGNAECSFHIRQVM
jgi:hypothetical protein